MRCVAQTRIHFWAGLILIFLFLPVNEGVAQTCLAPPPGLVSWWPLDEASGTTAVDIIGTNTGTHVNNPTPVAGQVAGALSFDGIDDFVQTNTIPPPSALTVDMWININQFQGGDGNADVIVRNGGVAAWQIDLFSQVGQLRFVVVGNFVITLSTSGWQTSTWYHVALVWDGNTLKGYRDGVLLGSAPASGTLNTPTGGHFIGSAQPTLTGVAQTRFNGLIDEVEVFDRALSSTEIQAIFNAGSAGKCKVLSVTIDIKPGSDPNSINLCSNGAVPIAILGSETFDVNDVNTETLRFAEASVKVVGKKDPHSLCSYEDVNGDFITDLVCHFVTTDIAGINGESTSATVNGELLDGTPIEGTDSVNIVKDTCH